MPIYEYECTACGHHHEAIQKISEAPLADCPSCHQPALKKLISAAGFRLSGSGWYETDFKQSNKRNLTSHESKEPKDAKDSKDSKDTSKSKEPQATKAGKPADTTKSSTSNQSASTGQ